MLDYALTTRGESSSDVMVNLFKGYLVAPEKEFATYIKQNKNDYEEGQNLQEDDLMTMAENKYKSLVPIGEWNAPSTEQKEILALTAKLESITKKKKLDKNEKSKEKFEWKKVAPENENDTRERNGKTYNWCTKHKMWTIHKSSKCTLGSPKEDNNKKKKTARIFS